MSSDWSWPGSRWWRVDLHTHSPASYDFGSVQDRAQPDWIRWIQAARDAGIHAVAVTDHNTAAGIEPLQQAAESVDGAPVVLPAVELTASDGTHLLLIMGPDCGQRHVEELLTKAKVSVDQRGRQDATSPLSVEQLLDLECDRGLVIVGAHVNRPSGLLEHDGQQRLKELRHPGLLGVEIDPEHPVDETWLDGSRAESPRSLPRIWCSDSHAFEQAGRRFTWVKMTGRSDLEGLRLALLDEGASSFAPARKDAPGDPNQHAGEVIESITVHKGLYIGQPEPLTVCFNPWLNAVIGGRGTGKSTLVDLCRVTLRREGELGEKETPLRAAFDKRVRVPPSRAEEGLLTTDTVVELIYRKDGQRFALAWDQHGRTPPITRLDGDGRTVEDGSITDRFPARIYSQKQLFELARAPNALLAVIDDAGPVRGAEIARMQREVEAQYLALAAEARALRAQAADLPARRVALGDVRRKIELLQSGGHASILTAYRQRRRQDSAWSSIQTSLAEGTTTVRQAAESLVVADLDVPGDRHDDPALVALGRAHSQTVDIINDLQRAVLVALDEAGRRLGEVTSGPDATAWREAVAASEQRYREVSEQRAAAGIASADEYRDLLQRATALEKEIEGLERSRALADAREQEASAALARRRELRAELARRRSEFVRAASGSLIRVAIRELADRAGFAGFLRNSLGIARFDDDHDRLADRCLPESTAGWSYAALDEVVAELRALPANPERRWPAGDHRFEAALRKLPPERIDRIALYAPGDAVEVSFRDPRNPGQRWRGLAHGSPGEQTAALLAFVLGYGNEPIILDQPEDDLDNTLIYELLVQRLRESKQSRQIIVITHNANIVVHGDAELVVSLHSVKGQTQVLVAGGLQEQAIRDEICRVMEGGKEAFKRRYRRIMRPGAT